MIYSYSFPSYNDQRISQCAEKIRKRYDKSLYRRDELKNII